MFNGKEPTQKQLERISVSPGTFASDKVRSIGHQVEFSSESEGTELIETLALFVKHGEDSASSEAREQLRHLANAWQPGMVGYDTHGRKAREALGEL